MYWRGSTHHMQCGNRSLHAITAKNGSKRRIECLPAMANVTYGTTRRRLRGMNVTTSTMNAKIIKKTLNRVGGRDLAGGAGGGMCGSATPCHTPPIRRPLPGRHTAWRLAAPNKPYVPAPIEATHTNVGHMLVIGIARNLEEVMNQNACSVCVSGLLWL